MGMTHPYKLMTTSNSDFQQKQYVNMKNPVEQNQQSPYPYAVLQQQGYQDQRLNPSSSGAAPFSVYGDAPPVSLPTTPQTPQQSGSVRGSGSFHSHPSTPGSSGTNSAQTRSVQPGSSSTPVQINNSDNIFPHQYSHAGTHVQKHDQLLANLTDYGSGMDDLNVPMSNDGTS
jgi:hypothetical protein